MEKCSLFVVFITAASVESENVRNEINFALSEKKPFIQIWLEETKLKYGLKLQIGSKQAIMHFRMEPENFYYKCTEAFVAFVAKGLPQDIQKTENKPLETPTTAIPPAANAGAAPAALSVESLMKRGWLFLEDSDWKQADDYFDKVLDIDPEYAPAYVGKLCAELRVKQEEMLWDDIEPISENSNFKKAVRFANAEY